MSVVPRSSRLRAACEISSTKNDNAAPLEERGVATNHSMVAVRTSARLALVLASALALALELAPELALALGLED
jgi:hypothetical protein